MRWMARNPFVFGLLAGAVVAGGVTAFVGIWEWVENPGGIFRGPDGTRWRFVRDTAVSWFVPSFPIAVIGCGLAHWLIRLLTSRGVRDRGPEGPRRSRR